MARNPGRRQSSFQVSLPRLRISHTSKYHQIVFGSQNNQATFHHKAWRKESANNSLERLRKSHLEGWPKYYITVQNCLCHAFSLNITWKISTSFGLRCSNFTCRANDKSLVFAKSMADRCFLLSSSAPSYLSE